MTDAYQVLAAASQHLFEEKRSTFTACLVPVKTRVEAMDALDDLRAEYPNASHYCWAYILGNTQQPISMAFSDDGEPSGTAGKPILQVLTHRQAGNCLAVVVRIFGGIKLGAGGLVRAYGSAVSEALDRAGWQTLTPTIAAQVNVDFANEERVRHCLRINKIEVVSVEYNQGVSLVINIPAKEASRLQYAVQQVTSGKGVLIAD